MLSCSTCWNSGRVENAKLMLREILDLGFRYVELGHGIRLSLIEDIQRYYDKGKVRFSTLHNFCPLPVEITRAAPDCYQFSSPEAFERQRAVKHTKQTIDFAKRFGATLVVLHMGSVRMRGYTEQLVAMAKAGKQFTREYNALKLEAVVVREKKAAPYLKRSRECLKEIVDYAGERGVRLGIEGRYAWEEIPNEREHLALLREFDFPHVGYWHDFGHIQVKHNLGFLDHAEFLESVRERCFGGHLHDTVWPDADHRVPFSGGIDYRKLVPILPSDAIFVWEMSPRRTREDIIASVMKWQEVFGADPTYGAPTTEAEFEARLRRREAKRAAVGAAG